MGYRHKVRIAPRMLAVVLSALMILAVVPVSAGASSPSRALAQFGAENGTGLVRPLVGALGVNTLDEDDQIPGVAAPSPHSGVIDLWSGEDFADVLPVTIPPGQVFTAEVKMSSGEWVQAGLFPPGSTDVWSDLAQLSWPVNDTTDRLSYYSEDGGTYYLALAAASPEMIGDGYLEYEVSFQSSAPGDYSEVGIGRPLASSQSDALDWRIDINDAYYVDLVEGDQIRLTLTGTADVDLEFWGPDPTTIWGWQKLAQYDLGTGVDTITYLVPPGGDGRYYAEVFASLHSATYTLTAVVSKPNVPRVSGDNRYLTSTAISKGTWATSDAMVIATGTNPADGLAASALAGALGAPVILAPPYSNVQNLASLYWEFLRLECTDVYIVGGDSAVDSRIDLDFGAAGATIMRVCGDDRYLTAVDVAEEMFSIAETDTVFVVRGDDFADALSVSPYAYAQGIPVLLTKTGSLHGGTAAFIEDNNITNVVVAGGTAAVSSAVVAQLERLNNSATNVTRLSGSTRYSTAQAVAEYAVDGRAWASWDFIGAATGQSFPDALSGGAACGRRGGALLLTPSGRLGSELASSIEDNDPDMVMIFGGTAAVSFAVASGIQNLMP